MAPGTTLVKLAERHGALVWASPLIGRCGFPEDHPLFAGFLPAFREEICKRLEGHDVLVAIGAPVFTYHAEGHGKYVPDGLKAFQLTEDPDWAASALAGQSMLGSVGAAIKDLLAVPRAAHPAAQRGRAPAPRLRRSGSAHRQLAGADAGGPARAGFHHRGRGAQHARPHAATPAHPAQRNVLHLQPVAAWGMACPQRWALRWASRARRSLPSWAMARPCIPSRGCGARRS